MSIRQVRRVAGLVAFALGVALVLSSLLFPWVTVDLGPAGKPIQRRGEEVIPYAPLVAAAFALGGVIRSRVRGNKDLAWISLFAAAGTVLLFVAFVSDRTSQRDLHFIGMTDLSVNALTLSHGYYMFAAGGVLFAFAGYTEYVSRIDPTRRRKRRAQ